MLTIVLTFMLGVTGFDTAAMSPRVALAAQTELHSKLRDALMQKLKSMSEADHAVFHEDVTAIAAPYFPIGQTYVETERVLAEQKLGPLRRFHGRGDSAGTTPFISHADLMSEMFSDVAIVLDFEFAGDTEHEMKLKKVSAFLQAASM